jgi:hypothetical protein
MIESDRFLGLRNERRRRAPLDESLLYARAGGPASDFGNFGGCPVRDVFQGRALTLYLSSVRIVPAN